MVTNRGLLARQGIAAVEFALVLPLLLMFIIGIWEVGRIIEIQQVLTNAAREGGRQASTGQIDGAGVASVVQNYSKNEGYPSSNVQVTVRNAGFPGNPAPPDNNPKNATDLDQLQITVTIPFKDVRWINLTLVTSDTSLVWTQVVWCSMKDLAYQIPAPPSGS